MLCASSAFLSSRHPERSRRIYPALAVSCRADANVSRALTTDYRLPTTLTEHHPAFGHLLQGRRLDRKGFALLDPAFGHLLRGRRLMLYISKGVSFMNIAVIFAGGTGTRMNTQSKPKQFLEMHGKPVLIYTLENFERIFGIWNYEVYAGTNFTRGHHHRRRRWRRRRNHKIIFGNPAAESFVRKIYLSRNWRIYIYLVESFLF